MDVYTELVRFNSVNYFLIRVAVATIFISHRLRDEIIIIEISQQLEAI